MYDKPDRMRNVRYRKKLEGYKKDKPPTQRYSHDYTLQYNERYSPDYNDPHREKPPQSKHPPPPNTLRKSVSIEWSVADTPYLHVGGQCSSMMTLDRRISASSDHLEREDVSGQNNHESFGFSPVSGDKFSERDFELRHERDNHVSMPEYTSHNMSKEREQKYSETVQRPRKTPFEMFLEDDGPYSRQLYGPVKSDKTVKTQKYRKSDRVVMKNVISRQSEPLVAETPSLSSTFGGISVKKGLLWQQRDSLFSR